jgi:hypothetical protein
MASGAELRGGVDVTAQQRSVLRAGRRVGNAAGAQIALSPPHICVPQALNLGRPRPRSLRAVPAPADDLGSLGHHLEASCQLGVCGAHLDV